MLTSVPGATKTRQIISGFPNVNEVKATLGYVIVDGGDTLESVWDLEVDLHNNYFDAHVSSVDLRVLALFDWVNDVETFEAFPIGVNDPEDGDRKVLQTPAKRDSSPLGWHNQGDDRIFTNTRGNNAYAQENWLGGSDWANNQRPDGGKELDFIFPIDLTVAPKEYINASTTNLFVWNNLIHDIFYEYGFDEVSGNFQENNFGLGGLGNDAVQANCQDGSGTNNANFLTPPDGQRSRMRMYVWTATNPYRDGDLEQGIVIHEYAHGISQRLTGGPQNVNCLGSGEAGGMGEGWGDFFATALRQRSNYFRDAVFPMGAYSSARPLGIRKFPYTTNLAVNPETYASVHAKGAVWTGILWESYWNFVDYWGFNEDWYLGSGGNNQDKILQADKVNFEGINVCRLWQGFAKRGLGLHAVGTSTGVTKVVESFEIPEGC